MPDDPRPESTASSRTLKRAADRLGGVAQLERWITGEVRALQAVERQPSSHQAAGKRKKQDNSR
ncbi:MAG TPA: hypothetical protein VFJ70_11410 [Burkholderiales bacterium]|nr:hypothetical protein [Burkholderiales bacterium]